MDLTISQEEAVSPVAGRRCSMMLKEAFLIVHLAELIMVGREIFGWNRSRVVGKTVAYWRSRSIPNSYESRRLTMTQIYNVSGIAEFDSDDAEIARWK